jgi:uncharacterized protein (UPF0548 family)
VFPRTAKVIEGETVAILSRQLRIWVLAACRVVDVVDESSTFGFTYATLPDHPECGYESFTVSIEAGRVRFDIDAVSKPGIPLVRVLGPIGSRLQERVSYAYLEALAGWIHNER